MPDTTHIQKPEVRSLPDLLHVQEGAVVSRVLLKDKGGNVTFFAFDAGEGLSEHTCPYHALVQGVEGAGEVDVLGQTHRLEAGDVLNLPPGEPHSVRALEAFKMLLVMIRNE